MCVVSGASAAERPLASLQAACRAAAAAKPRPWCQQHPPCRPFDPALVIRTTQQHDMLTSPRLRRRISAKFWLGAAVDDLLGVPSGACAAARLPDFCTFAPLLSFGHAAGAIAPPPASAAAAEGMGAAPPAAAGGGAPGTPGGDGATATGVATAAALSCWGLIPSGGVPAASCWWVGPAGPLTLGCFAPDSAAAAAACCGWLPGLKQQRTI